MAVCVCGHPVTYGCLEEDGTIAPMCVGAGCGEHASRDGRCRDCNIEHDLDRMECSTCKRMRYRTDTLLNRELGAMFWDAPCACPKGSP